MITIHLETDMFGGTVCGQPRNIGNVRTSLGHALNTMAYSLQSTLCNSCYMDKVRDIPFSDGLTLGKITDTLLEIINGGADEIFDVEEIEE